MNRLGPILTHSPWGLVLVKLRTHLIPGVFLSTLKQVMPRLATSVYRLRHDPMEQGPTEPHAERGTFLLSSGGAGGGYY